METEIQNKDCGKNCLRKYDKVYKLYTNLENEIMRSFCDDKQIDPAYLDDAWNRSMKDQEEDMEYA